MRAFCESPLSILLLVVSLSSIDAYQGAQRCHSLQNKVVNRNSLDFGASYRIKTELKASNVNSLLLRGGYITPLLAKAKSSLLQSPANLFNGLFLSLASIALVSKVAAVQFGNSKKSADNVESVKPDGVKTLQAKFLVVFWLMRMADWLQGPYFYEVYSSKIINGLPVSLDLVSKIFLVGFATTGLFGPLIGRLVDTVGRKAGTLAYAALYTIGALSTRSALLPLLLLGRVAGGLGTSLLFSAPEAWLVGEHQKGNYDGKWLGQTFGWAYAGDSLVAITAGQLASLSAANSGPTGPFSLSLLFLAVGSLIASLKWNENVATQAKSEATDGVQKESKPTIGDAWKVMKADKRILLLGVVQSLFEGAVIVIYPNLSVPLRTTL
jgi:MFS transporter, MFS domain-containing protein family, molybdate-anion transporter